MSRLSNPRFASRTVKFAMRTGMALPLLLVGCGGSGDRPELGTVTGTVTKNGEPLANAWITFNPEKGRASGGRTDEQGHYSLQYLSDAAGAKVGTHTVKIGTGGGQPEGAHTLKSVAASARKQLYEKSGVTVESGENVIDFEITEGNEYTGPARRGSRGGAGAGR